MAPERSGLSGRMRAGGNVAANVATEEHPARVTKPLLEGAAEPVETPATPEAPDAPEAPRLDDPRYPRPRWVRALRTVGIRAPLILLAYPVAVVVNLAVMAI